MLFSLANKVLKYIFIFIQNLPQYYIFVSLNESGFTTFLFIQRGVNSVYFSFSTEILITISKCYKQMTRMFIDHWLPSQSWDLLSPLSYLQQQAPCLPENQVSDRIGKATKEKNGWWSWKRNTSRKQGPLICGIAFYLQVFPSCPINGNRKEKMSFLTNWDTPPLFLFVYTCHP